ncbi:MAG: transglutaminase domain-containing protein [Bacteroidota bacterium]
MRYVFLAGVWLLATTMPILAQEIEIKLGKVPTADINMEVYPLDSTAEAVVLEDLQEVFFSSLYSVKIQRTLRIKILTAEGLDRGTFKIPVLTTGYVSVKGAVTNYENGSVQTVKLRKEHQAVEKVDDDFWSTTITFPNVKVGSVLDLEYSYSIGINSFVFGAGNFEFQSSIPIRNQVLELNIPEFLFFDFRQQGFEMINSFVKGRSSRMLDIGGDKMQVDIEKRVFYAHNMPALKEEPYVNNIDNYRAAVSMEIYQIQFAGNPATTFSKDWPGIEQELMESTYFGKVIEGNSETRKLAASITEGLTGSMEKLEAVANYIKENFEWNEHYGIYGDYDLRELLKKKEGDASNLNLLAVNLLREAGVLVNPVILSTRAHGVVNPFFPLLNDYNYVLAYVALNEEQGMFLDVTSRDMPLDMIPFRCLNGAGRILYGSGGDWIEVQTGKVNRQIMKGAFTLAEDGSLAGQVRLTTQGYQALEVVQMVSEDGEEVRDQDFKGDHTEWTFHKYELDDQLAEGGPMNEAWEAETEEVAMSAGDRIYLNALLGYGLTENPFQVETRRFPVDMGTKSDQTTMLQLQVPEGFEVEEVPENAVFTMPNRAGSYRMTYQVSGNQITIISKLSFAQAQYSVEEYPHLREFVNLVIAKNDGQIVLKKTTD